MGRVQNTFQDAEQWHVKRVFQELLYFTAWQSKTQQTEKKDCFLDLKKKNGKNCGERKHKRVHGECIFVISSDNSDSSDCNKLQYWNNKLPD